MSERKSEHRHLDDERIEELARARLEDGSVDLASDECRECELRVTEHARYLSLAGMLVRDTSSPFGHPAIEAVRIIRRQSYRRRALGEIAALLTTSPMKVRV